MPITELRIEGLRTIEKLRLGLDGLTVLIGDNGAGKSSIIEACELLRRSAGERFMDEFYSIHGGMVALLRQGAPRLSLGVTIRPIKGEYPQFENTDWSSFESVEYDLTLLPSPSGAFSMMEETIRARLRRTAPRKSRKKTPNLKRKATKDSAPILVHRFDDEYDCAEGMADVQAPSTSAFSDGIDKQTTFVSQVVMRVHTSMGETAGQVVAAHLRNLRVHLPFEVMPAWAARALDRKSALRSSTPFAPADHLEKLGVNLANAFHTLKNNFGQDEWNQTLTYVRLGLGEHIEDVTTWADPGGGSVGLSLKLKNLDRQIPSSQLSDGMLSYLAFVALFRLHGTRPSLMALDEPDLHLHPKLLMRVLDMFESMARDFPVLVATHSDRLLDGLSDPARSVVLCELDENLATRLRRPDPRALAKWLERYRGLGDIRGAGHEGSVLTREEPS